MILVDPRNSQQLVRMVTVWVEFLFDPRLGTLKTKQNENVSISSTSLLVFYLL